MKQIFLVEDDDGIRELLEYLLQSRNYGVDSFPTSKEFQKGIKRNKPDLILMDIMLPDGNGLEICRMLNQDENTAYIPVILMSAHESEHNSRKVGAKDFIAKPFDVEDLFSTLEMHL